MMFAKAFLSLLVAGTAAATSDIAADSSPGNKILSKARKVEQGYYNGEVDYTWVADYSIKFEKCHSVHSFNAEEAEREEGSSPHGTQNLVTFKLCPSDSSNCKKGGEYVVQMREFVEAYIEAKNEIQEQECQAVEENCNCDYYYGDDQACLNKCYADAGLDYCVDNGEEEFNAEQYMECVEAEFSNDAYYDSTYFIGPKCSSNGKSIHLELYKDASCSKRASSGAYEKYNYGSALPYSKTSLVSSEPLSCKEPAENEYYNAYQQDEPIEFCTQLYEESGKCEKRMSKSSKDVDSCTYINNILPALESVHKKNGSGSSNFFAWLFFFTTVAASAAAFYFFTASTRSNVDLSGKNQMPGSGML